MSDGFGLEKMEAVVWSLCVRRGEAWAARSHGGPNGKLNHPSLTPPLSWLLRSPTLAHAGRRDRPHSSGYHWNIEFLEQVTRRCSMDSFLTRAHMLLTHVQWHCLVGEPMSSKYQWTARWERSCSVTHFFEETFTPILCSILVLIGRAQDESNFSWCLLVSLVFPEEIQDKPEGVFQ